MLTDSSLKSGCLVTTALILIYYIFIVCQAGNKILHKRKAKKDGVKTNVYYNNTDKTLLGWDRAVGNLHEQSLPFLTMFWGALALLGDKETAGWRSVSSVVFAGWFYVVARAFYPVIWLAGNGGARSGPRTPILMVTLSNYLVILYLTIVVVSSAS